MNALRTIATTIDSVVDMVGRIASLIVFLLMGLLFLEMIKRYVFDAPTSFVHEVSAMLFAVMFLFGGAYAVCWNSHVSVNIVVEKLSPRTRTIIQIVASAAFYLFIGTLFVLSVPYAIDSIAKFERSSSSIALPVWPVKLCIPIASGLVLLAGISVTIKSVAELVTGKPLLPPAPERQLCKH